MNIRLKKNILTDDGVKFESEIIELNDELAQKLVKAGQAETVDKQITESDEPSVEELIDKIPTSRKTGRK
ncbi:MAG: hypothetical protein MR514_02060 [Succinivibrio sp.]|jgi:hypothetical protein|uniref:hypothetical protein n=1 Tax=Succinivibrio sp. TaxID=2053619 RepID=UPI002A289D61|nr:hypothetical protein [Succinatimonas sp.]MCI7772634.1 hypothetical protein [Succinivibrio sp.]MDD6376977.1 hypothetical protein [Succinatimonas sp.]